MFSFAHGRREDGWAAGRPADGDQAAADQQGELWWEQFSAMVVVNEHPLHPMCKCTLTQQECTLCSFIHQSELFIHAELLRGAKRRKGWSQLMQHAIEAKWSKKRGGDHVKESEETIHREQRDQKRSWGEVSFLNCSKIPASDPAGVEGSRIQDWASCWISITQTDEENYFYRPFGKLWASWRQTWRTCCVWRGSHLLSGVWQKPPQQSPLSDFTVEVKMLLRIIQRKDTDLSLHLVATSLKTWLVFFSFLFLFWM